MTDRSVNETRVAEQGFAGVMFAVLAVAFLMATGLAVDGGRKLGALSEARDIADNAARAGAQMVDEDAYKQTGIATIDPDAATQRALEYLSAQGYDGNVVVSATDVIVTVTINVNTTFLPGPMTASATESATASTGT